MTYMWFYNSLPLYTPCLISFSPHLIAYVSIVFLSFDSPQSHLFYVPLLLHGHSAFVIIVSFTYQLSVEINHLRVPLDMFLMLDRYSLFESEIQWFYSYLSSYIKQEIQLSNNIPAIQVRQIASKIAARSQFLRDHKFR